MSKRVQRGSLLEYCNCKSSIVIWTHYSKTMVSCQKGPSRDRALLAGYPRCVKTLKKSVLSCSLTCYMICRVIFDSVVTDFSVPYQKVHEALVPRLRRSDPVDRAGLKKIKTIQTAVCDVSWWRHQMETFIALLALCARNSPVTGEFPAQRPMKRSFDVFFDLRLNKRSSKQWWGWWFETPSHPLWCHCIV